MSKEEKSADEVINELLIEEHATTLKEAVNSAKELIAIKEKLSILVKDEKEARFKFEALQGELFKLLSDSGVQSINVDSTTLYQRVDTYVAIKPEGKEEAFLWLKEIGLGDLIKQAVNSRNLTSAMKEEFSEGEDLKSELSSDMFRVSVKNRIGLRRS